LGLINENVYVLPASRFLLAGTQSGFSVPRNGNPERVPGSCEWEPGTGSRFPETGTRNGNPERVLDSQKREPGADSGFLETGTRNSSST